MKANKLFIILGTTAVLLSGCTQSDTQPDAASTQVSQSTANPESSVQIPVPVVSASTESQESLGDSIAASSPAQEPTGVSEGDTAIAKSSSPDAELVALLTYLVQEEKLAKDLYTELALTSGARQFANIKKSEAKHVSSVQKLLATYGISDPTVGLAAGEFVNDELQALYDTLLASGSADYAGAIAAGIAVEETDIADIKEMLKGDLPADVEKVLNSLLSASYNHLAAFSKA